MFFFQFSICRVFYEPFSIQYFLTILFCRRAIILVTEGATRALVTHSTVMDFANGLDATPTVTHIQDS